MSPPIEANSLPSLKSLTKTHREPGKNGLRRISMLNKLFMKHITDIMSTGTVSMDIVGRGIEISKVTVTPDFHTVNVFWVCKGDSTDEETEAVLSKTAGALRHELSTLRAMGEVPYIVFVKDKVESMLVDLDRRLTVADYGEDYEPMELGHLLKSEFTLDTRLSPEMQSQIKKLEDDIFINEDPIPEMTHTVYGLDHAKIMNRLLASRKRSRDAWSNLNEDPNLISYRKSITTSSVKNDIGEQRQELAQFLRQRKILSNKLLKQKHERQVDFKLIEDEDYHSNEDVDDFDDDYYEHDDYFDTKDEQQEETKIDKQKVT